MKVNLILELEIYDTVELLVVNEVDIKIYHAKAAGLYRLSVIDETEINLQN